MFFKKFDNPWRPLHAVFLQLLVSCNISVHRSGFQHQIASTPAADYIAFFSLIQFLYGTLTHQMRSPGSVVVNTLTFRTKGSGINSRWTCLAIIALLSNIDT